MKIEIITHKEKLYDAQAKEVVLPGVYEEFSVLDFHQPFLYRLKRGYVKVFERQDKSKKGYKSFLIQEGIAKMLGNTLTVLAQD
jgi:F0F1-type ATP synthase epsilon subunit|tara:strand:+ start:36 stop:287 length:252 start_codon:yes stop_codon:yes gene_type:complete